MNFVNTFKKYPVLGVALKYIIDNSQSIFKPYHNLNHNITVTVFSNYIGVREGLPKKEMVELLLAAIFHDFNHSGGEKKDTENIKAAKKGVKDFLKETGISDIDIDNVFNIIDATEYPYVIPNDKLSTQQKIIRDADLCQLFENQRLQMNYLGLGKESNTDMGTQIKNQDKFISTIKFNTKAAKDLFSKNQRVIKEELNYLKSILTNKDDNDVNG